MVKNINFKIKNGKIVYMNEYARIHLRKELIEYILSRVRNNENFEIFVDSSVYLCGIVENNETMEVSCLNISDLKNKLGEISKNLKKREEEERNLYSLMDFVVHDIKNYNALLEGYGALLEKEGFKEEYIQEMRAVVGEMKNIVRRASIMLKSPEHIKREKINIGEIIGGIVKHLESKAREKNIKIVNSTKKIQIWGDPMLRDVFFNLIDNAINYSPQHSEVKIVTEENDDGIVIKVIDSGPGIPEDMRDLIFSRFKRGRGGMGMGLGLAIAKHVVEMHGGKIWIEENPSGGSIFCVKLPVK